MNHPATRDMLNALPSPVPLDIAILFTALAWCFGFYLVDKRVYLFASLAIGCFVCLVAPGRLSPFPDTGQISWGKHSRLPCTVAESTLCTFDGYGLRGKLPARPAPAPYIRFLSIDSHVCSTLLSDLASRR